MSKKEKYEKIRELKAAIADYELILEIDPSPSGFEMKEIHRLKTEINAIKSGKQKEMHPEDLFWNEMFGFCSGVNSYKEDRLAV